ncbi:uncharacterized protein [Apostichopus japonicus]|uniref:uncharacterized protein isoform X2 n=1 Tax=Stichopus japonicus TaxID=307972 RepID=UPI003AB8B7B4
MKPPTLWALVLMGGLAVPLCTAMPAGVSDNISPAGASWELQAFLIVMSLVVIVTLLGMCACGDKPQTSDHVAGNGNQDQPAQIMRQQSQSSGGDGHSQGGTNPPLPSTPNGPPYQNIHENGTVQAPPSPQDGAKGGSASPITRTGTIDRQLPAIPPIGAVGPRKSMDYDGDYDTIRTGKDEDYDCTYALVKEKDNNISPIAETESDYADVPDVRRRPMPNNFGEYADVDNSKGGDAGKKTSGGVQEGAKSPKVVPVERIAPRAEPEPDISDAEYAVVDIKEARTPRATAATPSTSKDATELYASVKVGKEQGAVGGAQVKKNHGYAKIGDVRVEGSVPGGDDVTEGSQGADQAGGSSPSRPSGTPPPRSPVHSTGSPSHQQRFQPEVDESTLGAVGGVGTGLGPDGVQLVGPDQVINEDPSLQNAGKKEPRYSQVSARESLARLRARQMAENNQASAGDGSRYQSMDEGPLEEEEDHNGLYESVDYQAVNKTEDTSTSVDNTTNTLPPRRGRVYEEINDREGANGSNDADTNIEPYAVVEPLGRRKTAPSKLAARNDSSGSDFSELYAKVDKQPKLSQGLSVDSAGDGQDFDELYAKVNKKKAPKKVQSFDDTCDDVDPFGNDGMYAEVKSTPRVDNTAKAATNNDQAAAKSQDYDDSYQSIDDIRAEQKIEEKAKEAGMVHVNEVQTAPVLWTRPEHMYASVDREAKAAQNGEGSQVQDQRQHNYEVVDKKQLKKGKQKKKAKGKEDKKASKEDKKASKEDKKSSKGDKSSSKGEKSSGKSSPKKDSPTHLDSRQLKLLADKAVKETDL